MIGTLVRRPVYYMAKRELFEKRWQAWLLNGLGAFPSIAARATAMRWTPPARSSRAATASSSSPRARACARDRSASPAAGVGRLALETGAPVAPVAVIGTDDVRRGWRIRPRKVRLRVGRPLRFPHRRAAPRPARAAAVTERIWACVSLQWEWLGGVGTPREEVGDSTPRARRATLPGAAGAPASSELFRHVRRPARPDRAPTRAERRQRRGKAGG